MPPARIIANLLVGLGLGITLWAVTVAAYTVDNGRIKNASGEVIELRGISWYGAEIERQVPSGLFKRNYVELIGELQSLGFNAIRLPFCPEIVDAPALPADWFWINKAINPGLVNEDGSGKRPLEILRLIAVELDRRGMVFVLDHHRSRCSQEGGPFITPLWYDENYSESQWLDTLSAMAATFAPLEHFLGFDIKNEPHHQATWAEGNPATDWDAAAVKASRRVLAQAPKILVFVEGISENSHCGGDDYPFWFSDWGGNLARQHCEPINIPKSKLVLAPHAYGPAEGEGGNTAPRFFTSDARDPHNNPGTPADMRTALPQVWDQLFGRLAEPRNGNYAITIGEFGLRYGRFLTAKDDPLIGIKEDDSEAVKQRKRKAFEAARTRDKPWADAFVGYLTEKGITDTFWWAINGDGEIGGLYYGFGLPRPDGSVHKKDEWVKLRTDIVNNNSLTPGLLNRLWEKAACFDGLDNDQDGHTDAEDPNCADIQAQTRRE